MKVIAMACVVVGFAALAPTTDAGQTPGAPSGGLRVLPVQGTRQAFAYRVVNQFSRVDVCQAESGQAITGIDTVLFIKSTSNQKVALFELICRYQDVRQLSVVH